MNYKDIEKITLTAREGDLIAYSLDINVDVPDGDDYPKIIRFISIIVHPHPIIYTKDAVEMINKNAIVRHAQLAAVASSPGLETVHIFFPQKIKYKQSADMIDFYLKTINISIESITHESNFISDYNSNLQNFWLVRGILQARYCLGVISSPEQILTQIFGKNLVESCRAIVELDLVIYNSLKEIEILEKIQSFFKNQGWAFDFNSSWDIHIALMEEAINQQVADPYKPYDTNQIKSVTQSGRKTKKENLDFIRFMKGKKTVDNSRFISVLESSLSGRILLSLRYCRNLSQIENHYSRMLSLLVKNYENFQEGQKYYWAAQTLYAIDPVARCLRPVDSI